MRQFEKVLRNFINTKKRAKNTKEILSDLFLQNSGYLLNPKLSSPMISFRKSRQFERQHIGKRHECQP